MIQIEEVTKKYGQKVVLDKINLRFAKGKITGLLGPNGAGKTTLVSVLTGINNKDSGIVRVDDKNLDTRKKDIHRLSSLVPQFLAFYPRLTAYENLEYFGGIQGLRGQKLQSRIEAAVSFGSLDAFLHKRAEQFSGGMKRRLNLAIGILNQPRVLYLDEPTVGVDPQSRNYIINMIKKINREEKTTVIYTSHYIEEIEQISDEVVIIDHGKIILHENRDTLLAKTSEICIECDEAEKLSTVAREEAGIAANVIGDKLYIPAVGDYMFHIEKIIGIARTRAFPIQSIRFGTKNLEELFLKLTTTRLRD